MTEHDPSMALKIWVAKACTYNGYSDAKIISETRYAAIMPLLFTHAIIVGRIGDATGYEDRWCFKDYETASKAMDQWDGTGEPEGWHRHPNTGRRRRPDGTEYIDP